MHRTAPLTWRFLALLVLLVAAPSNTPMAQVAPARSAISVQSEDTIVITNVTLIDVASGARQPGTTVITKAGQIIDIGPNIRVPPGAVRLDGTRRFLIPGLWDMHSHNEASGAESLKLYLANGVVGTRDMGSDLELILSLRDRTRRDAQSGPEIVAAGPILDDAPADWPFRRRVTNAQEAREAVRDLQKRGVDFIKVHNYTPRDAFFAIAEEAPKVGLPFAGHVPLGVTMDEGATSGIKSIEHLSEFRVFTECAGKPQPYDAERCRPFFEKLAANDIWHTPTLGFYEVLLDVASGKSMPHAEYASDSLLDLTRKNIEVSKLDERAMSLIRLMRKTALTVVRDMLPRGNLFLAGCDGGVPGFCLHDELQALTRAGLSPLQAIQAATINPAKLLGRTDTQGSIDVGKRADLVLLHADPLQDIRNTRRIAAVIVLGELLAKADIDRLLAAQRRQTP
ncbi:MAG: amidohydrolase family protein [Vicinamibacteraceae bacterium]